MSQIFVLDINELSSQVFNKNNQFIQDLLVKDYNYLMLKLGIIDLKQELLPNVDKVFKDNPKVGMLYFDYYSEENKCTISSIDAQCSTMECNINYGPVIFFNKEAFVNSGITDYPKLTSVNELVYFLTTVINDKYLRSKFSSPLNTYLIEKSRYNIIPDPKKCLDILKYYINKQNIMQTPLLTFADEKKDMNVNIIITWFDHTSTINLDCIFSQTYTNVFVSLAVNQYTYNKAIALIEKYPKTKLKTYLFVESYRDFAIEYILDDVKNKYDITITLEENVNLNEKAVLKIVNKFKTNNNIGIVIANISLNVPSKIIGTNESNIVYQKLNYTYNDMSDYLTFFVNPYQPLLYAFKTSLITNHKPFSVDRNIYSTNIQLEYITLLKWCKYRLLSIIKDSIATYNDKRITNYIKSSTDISFYNETKHNLFKSISLVQKTSIIIIVNNDDKFKDTFVKNMNIYKNIDRELVIVSNMTDNIQFNFMETFTDIKFKIISHNSENVGTLINVGLQHCVGINVSVLLSTFILEEDIFSQDFANNEVYLLYPLMHISQKQLYIEAYERGVLICDRNLINIVNEIKQYDQYIYSIIPKLFSNKLKAINLNKKVYDTGKNINVNESKKTANIAENKKNTTYNCNLVSEHF